MKRMIRLSRYIISALAAAVCLAQTPGTPNVGAPESRSSARILKVGVVDIEAGKRAYVEEESVDLVGAARNYRGYSLAALVQPRGQSRYFAAAVSAAEPGNLFTIAGVRFPSRDCDLLVGIFPSNSITPGTWIKEGLLQKALALSERVPVTALRPVAAAAQTVEETSPGADIAITSIDNQSVSPTEKVVVPVSTDVITRAQMLPPGYRVYLRLRIPYTNKCIVHRASPGNEPGAYLFRDVLFEAPGDPLVVQFSVIAFATRMEVAPGVIGCETLAPDQLITSPTIDVSVDRKRGQVDLERVPFILITKAGGQEIPRKGKPGALVTVRQGDSVEVGATERLPQGAVITLWGHERGSHLWLVSPPLVPRGNSTLDSDADVAVTWVLPSARFSSPEAAANGASEYELMAVLSSNALYPNTWLDTSALAAHSIETVSEIVPVRLRDPDPPFETKLTMESVCGQEVPEDRDVQLRRGCPVVVGSRSAIPPFLRVLVAGHLVGDDSWTVVQAMRTGKSFIVPEFPMQGEARDDRWQLVAIVSPGALPAAKMRYADFLPHLGQTSPVVMVVRDPSAQDHGTIAPESGAAEPEGNAKLNAGLNVRSTKAMAYLLLLLIAIALLLMIVEWQFGAVSETCGWAAGQIGESLDRFEQQLETPAKIHVGSFLLGLAILGFLSWLIATQYLRLYTEIVAAVTNLDIRESRGWATYLVVMAGMAGVLIDVSQRISGQRKASEGMGLFQIMNAFLFFGAFVLWSFSAGLYWEYLRRTSGALVAPLGGAAAFLVSLIETVAFFYGVHLVLDELGWLAARLLLLPFRLLVMFLAFLQKIFAHRRHTSPRPAPPDAAAPGGGRILGAAAGD